MPGDPVAVRDLSPFQPPPAAGDMAWLRRLQEHVRASDHVIRLGESADVAEDDLIVGTDHAGNWRAGRYIGEIRFEGRTLRIEPRLGMPAIESLLGEATNLVVLRGAGSTKASEAFIARLMAALWCRAFDAAARHGPPAFRRQTTFTGPYVRGQLDVRATMRLRSKGAPHVSSVLRSRDLDNAVSRVVVAAARTLSQQIGDDRWQTRRVRELLPLMRAAVGSRPRLPPDIELRSVRYTPITRPYQELASLSLRIARLEGMSAVDADGRGEGILLDVAELWELHVLRSVRAALPGLSVIHGTTDSAVAHLLRSRDHEGRGLGRLLPDVLVSDAAGLTLAVIDAKYKRLNNSAERPNGVDRGDLYQLTSYLSRFAPDGRAVGMLVYPALPDDVAGLSSAETYGPWESAAGHDVRFTRLAVDEHEARDALTEMIALPLGVG